MENWKTILGVFGASVGLVILMAVGLSKLSGSGGETITVPVEQLTEGARWEVTTGEAKVTVAAFTDIQCPACKAAEPMAVALRLLPGVKFVHRHFPLTTIHKNAWKGARALEAARMMGKGWEMMALMFDKQTEWSDLGNPDDKFVSYAKDLGLAEDQFREKYLSKETDEAVGVDSSLGSRLKLAGTPTYFVNGEQVAASFVLDRVKELLK
ncbi:MAG: DSBA oxidoreductase [Candidatus Beckwithbacteria bacterium GW2011_GWC2_49_11]|nr:MAG: DSBA oxidoreductase [Candidatus Beckwithbacteria bacterium GW2011_GWC2_49_11]